MLPVLLHSLTLAILFGVAPGTDTVKKLAADDYPVTDKMFGKWDGKEIRNGDLTSSDEVWFSNDSLNQSLVFLLSTDDARVESYLFYNNNIPEGLMKRIGLNNDKGEMADMTQKKEFFKGFIKLSKKIRPRYFITDKGFHLGSGEQDAIAAYGKPDKIAKIGTTERWEWSFEKPLSENIFGNQVTMFFQENKLIGLILSNGQP